jgi:Protein of unknown function (DUF3352)
VRALALVALASLTLFAAGCGGSASVRSDPAGANLGSAAAKLVPPDAVAFVSLDTDRSSTEWQRLDQLTSGLPARGDVVQKIQAALAEHGLSYDRDVAPAIGNELDYAVLKSSGSTPDVVAFAQPSDVGKLRSLASKFDSAGEHYTVQQVGGWSVVADSDAAFAAVKAAAGGRSLADTQAYASARAQIGGNAIAWYFAAAQKAAEPAWTAAKLDVGSDVVRASAAAAGNNVPAPSISKLMRDVPSGAAFAASFESSAALKSALRTAKLPNIPVAQLAPLLDGGGVAYVRPKGIFPELAIELTPTRPANALAQARALLRTNAGKFGPLPLTAKLSGGKLVIFDAASAAAALRGGSKLVDQAAFKNALSAAAAPARTSALVYANVSQLAPFLQLAAAGSGHQVDPALGDTLGRIGPLVAWATRSGGVSYFQLWAQKH